MADEAQEPLWNKTLRRIREYWPLGDPVALKDTVGPDLTGSDLGKVRKKINACLEGKGGEVSARSRAAELGETYSVLSSKGRRRFLQLLAGEFDVSSAMMEEAITSWQEAADVPERRKATARLKELLDPPRTRLLRQFNGLQGGVKFLVDLRAELLDWAREDPDLKALDRDVHHLLASWFDVGFFDLQQITWNTSAALLEKFIKYESVHEITSWDDLKNRLEEDRCCYAFFHPSMPDEPLIFVEVALVNGMAANIHALLDQKAPPVDPEKADTAIFYSISNCQKGLAGVSFGNFLIKRVVADLASRLPNIKTFSTLSPIPGFVGWLREQVETLELSEQELECIEVFQEEPLEIEKITELLEADPDNKSEQEKTKRFQEIVQRLCARYLLEAKRGSKVWDRVAHFHLTNGAMIKQINWAANTSMSGIEQSAGMMVNYLYDLPAIEKRHESYSSQGTISASPPVRRMAK